MLSPKINLFFNKFTQKIYFDRMKSSSHIMKYFKVTNKLRISGISIFDKIESFSFRWLRRVFQQLISHQKALVLVASSLTRDHGYPPKDGSFGYLLKGTFNGLGEPFKQLISHRKALVSAV